MKYLLGLDIGSSSIKACLIDVESGESAASAASPAVEMAIDAPQAGFAEQHPDTWWEEVVAAVGMLKREVGYSPDQIAAIGISYQMHGLVCVDSDGVPVRPSIIWCDGRAVEIGDRAFSALGESYCLEHFLNAPGNFTASKLRWVIEHEPDTYERTYRIMLPGDYIAYRLTGEMSTTVSGLSEGILWDYAANDIARSLLEHYGIGEDRLPPIVPQFGIQGRVHARAAAALGLSPGVPVTYRAGDQPNNAFSLNVLQPGEIAATAGTSGVVYGVTDKAEHDPQSRVNAFVHVNHTRELPRYGILLCINGTGILNGWLRRNMFPAADYAEMNRLSAEIPVGSEGLRFYPFGNGAERVLGNRDTSAWMEGLQFNRHDARHVARAAQEGIVFSLHYGMEVMRSMGMDIRTVRAGHANMFLSPVFGKAFANVTGCRTELFNTDGAQGAARAAGLGAGLYAGPGECFRGLHSRIGYEPESGMRETYAEAYAKWKEGLLRAIG